MKIKDLQEIPRKDLDKGEGTITFYWNEIQLQDLENYTDDITVDGDHQTLEFYIQ